MSTNYQDDNEGPLFNFGEQGIPAQVISYAKIFALIVAAILLFFVLSFSRSVYTDWLWFNNLQLSGVFVTVLTTKFILFLVGALIFGMGFAITLFFAYKNSGGPTTLTLPEKASKLIDRSLKLLVITIGVVLSVIFGYLLASNWEMFLRFTNSVPFGQIEPVFGKDISFYVFSLPVLNAVQSWLLGATILFLLSTFALYFVRYGIRGVTFSLTTVIKIQLSILAALVMFILAWGHWIDRWELLLSESGSVFGAAYTDINARKPALLILTVIATLSGVLLLINTYFRGLKLLIGAVALWLAFLILVNTIWPSAVQQLTVNPNEFVKEEPFIKRNIEFTRTAYGLTDVSDQFFPVRNSVNSDLIKRNKQTINNIRLWDYRPLSDVYRQTQLIRSYYDFKDADVDRYNIGGELRQVLLSAREVAPEKLDEDSQTWTNNKLVYTHGMGIAMSPVTEFTQEGKPQYFAKDIPAEGIIPISGSSGSEEPDLLVTNPRIYYGENTLDYVIVNTKTEEVDYQTEDGQLFRTKYPGEGGVQLSSFFKRLAFAWQFTDVNILISGQITNESRLQYRREIQERVQTIAPFIELDADPYIVAAEGQLFWIQDGYTSTDHFPYSDPMESGDNYIRNSLKIVINAFSGDTEFYIWDDSDPIVMTYAKIFPSLFRSGEDMPEEIKSHVRYPQGFFSIQADKYLRYHMTEPQNFYNNEDLWSLADEKFGQGETLQVVEPYYVIMKLPGEEKEEFVLRIPNTPNERQNLVGWMAARSDGENYGKLVAFSFPKDRQVDGPAQVEARIDNDQDISAWFTLRCTEGSSCIRGNLLVIPIEDSLLYAEPVYIQAEGVTFPELKRVILATGDTVVMEDSLHEALASLTGDESLLLQNTSQEDKSPTLKQESNSGILSEMEILQDTIKGLKDHLSSLEQGLQRLTEALTNK